MTDLKSSSSCDCLVLSFGQIRDEVLLIAEHLEMSFSLEICVYLNADELTLFLAECG